MNHWWDCHHNRPALYFIVVITSQESIQNTFCLRVKVYDLCCPAPTISPNYHHDYSYDSFFFFPYLSPFQVLMLADGNTEGFLYQRLPILASLVPQDGKATAYVCENFVCALPVTCPQELRRLLLEWELPSQHTNITVGSLHSRSARYLRLLCK